jgi:hypothetical protein
VSFTPKVSPMPSEGSLEGEIRHHGHATLRWLGACNAVERGIAVGLLRAAKIPDASAPDQDPSPADVSEMKELHRHDALATSPVEFIEALMSSFQRQRVRLLQGVSQSSPSPSECPLQPSPGFLLAGREFFHPAVFQALSGELVEDTDSPAGTSISVGVLRSVGLTPVVSKGKRHMSVVLRELGARFEWPDEEGLHSAVQNTIERQHHRVTPGAPSDDCSDDSDEEGGFCMRSQMPSFAWNVGNKRPREGNMDEERDAVELAPVILDVAVEGPKRSGKASAHLDMKGAVLGIYDAKCSAGCVPNSQTAVLRREVLLDGGQILLQ